MFFATDYANESESTSSSSQWPQPCRHFQFAELQLATDNFDESLVIGRGGFGKVYKGTIVNGASLVVAAIKRLDLMSSQGADEFWAEVEMLSKLRNYHLVSFNAAEVEMLSKLRHYHLVSLIGYCNDGKEKILAYEYVSNGTLEDHLHKRCTPLSWLQRLKICIGAAHGLDYLHTCFGNEAGVIHRDVKSSNILLNETWEAKISDFGLSKIGPMDQPTSYVSTKVKGTFGYLDPNYFYTGRLTRKSDVYAFGVVLLEVLCRKLAVDESLDEEQWGLARWAQDSIKEGNLKHIIDSDMRNQISPKCLKEFVRIAVRCLHDRPKERPTMAEVVLTLESVRALQEKANSSLEHAGRTVFGRMVDMLPLRSKGEHSVHGDSKLSSNSKGDGTSAIIPSPSLQVFKFGDLKRSTRNFGPDMFLGEGACGKVFLGWIEKDTFASSSPALGMPVAVKRFHHNSSDEWLTEVNLLGRLAHPNINTLLGYCNHKKEKLLVYKYMQNGTFGSFLFKDAELLSWGTRLSIMTDVARVVTYLHSIDVQVIHRDVKPDNIFLDQDFNAKLGGFWLAISGPGIGNTHVSTRVMGILGYIDPEYSRTGSLTVKSDIYGFGITLLETLAARRRVDIKQLEEHLDLAAWVCLVAKNGELKNGELEKIMDPRLEKNYPIEGAIECLELAAKCVADESKDRPSSEEVLQSLEAISALTSNVYTSPSSTT